MKKGLFIIGALTLCSFTVGAATGIKINAELKNQIVNCNGGRINQEVVSYNGTTYVPLRAFSNMLGVTTDYVNGEIIIESPKPVVVEKPVEISLPAKEEISDKPKSKYNIENPAPNGSTQTISFNGYDFEVTVKNSRQKFAYTNRDTGEGYYYIEADVELELLNSSTNRDEAYLYGLFGINKLDGGRLTTKTWNSENDIRDKTILPGGKVTGTVSNEIKNGEKYMLSFGLGNNMVYFQL